MIRPRRVLARVAGNFGISFFSPLISGNLAEQIFEMGISFEDTLIIAGLSSIFVTGYTMSKELRDWGREKKRDPDSNYGFGKDPTDVYPSAGE